MLSRTHIACLIGTLFESSKHEAFSSLHSFTCSCGMAYEGRTTSRLAEKQIPEYRPVWMNTGEIRACTSFNSVHILLYQATR